jgi:hypothetical protein
MANWWETAPLADDKGGNWWDAAPVPNPGAKEIATDVAKSGGVGVGKGTIGLFGTIGDIGNLASYGLTYGTAKAAEKLGLLPAGKTAADFMKAGEELDKKMQATPARGIGAAAEKLFTPPTSKEIQTNIEKDVTGPFYKPQTTAGKYAETIGEFIPAAAAMPGRTLPNIAKFGALPGAAVEGIGQATDQNPWARLAGGVGTATVAAALGRPNVANRMIATNAGGTTQPQFDAAERLIRDAAARGINITPAEAMQQVTGGATGMGTLQRIVESTPEGAQTLGPMMATRPGQMQAATETSLNTIAPRSPAPSYLGPQMQEAGQGALGQINTRINAAAEPFYTASAGTRIPPADFANITAVPGWGEAVQAIRNNPQLNRYVAGLPDDSVGMLNEVKKYLGQQGDNFASELQQGRNLQVSAGYNRDSGTVRQAAINADPNYEQALNIESTLRQRALDPFRAGPGGQIAATDDFVTQGRALLGDRPSPQEVGIATGMLNAQNPQATAGLIREHLGRIADKTVGGLDTAGRPDQYGGARFSREVSAGRPGQNIDAALNVINPAANANVQRLVEVLGATGWRQRPGSMTAFNQEALGDLKRGGINSIVQALAKPAARAQETVGRMRLSGQAQRLSELLASPDGLAQIREIARTGTGTQRALAQALIGSTPELQRQ